MRSASHRAHWPRHKSSVSDYGTTADGRAVHVYTLTNAHGMSVKVLDYGGTITEINAPDRHGKTANVVLGLSDLKAYEANGGLNTLIGRYANRIKGGFTIDGKHYDLAGSPRRRHAAFGAPVLQRNGLGVAARSGSEPGGRDAVAREPRWRAGLSG